MNEKQAIESFQYRCKIGLVVLVALLSIYVLWPFIGALLWSGILALTFLPLHKKLEQRFHSFFSATLTLMAIVSVVIIPLAYTTTKAVSEIPDIIDFYNQSVAHGIHLPAKLNEWPKLHNYLQTWIDNHPISQQGDKIKGVASHLLKFTHRFGEIAEATGISLMATFFLLVYHKSLTCQFNNVGHFLLGTSGEDLSKKAVSSVRGTVAGLVLVGLGEGFLSFPVLLLTGTPHPAILGFGVGILAIIPLCAPIFLSLICAYTFMTLGMTPAIIDGVVIFSILFIGDHFIRPGLIGGANKLPFMVVILGILGGLHAFGILGLFIGPAIFTIAVTLWKEVAMLNCDTVKDECQ